ncbi:FAD-binding oxidoreductase [Leptospira levettii]|uniref:FAD-binding oxidoreductase n=1 Tax=Leptospira levettii TaxID=2023178 RepID=A0AAW5V8V0_9LEPT|nr:FAD-binding oxidoreductase [Leptospira levettii]MCW7467386.1 FAD-binding oxidoreductase [Leptospira levettii]MCW7513108.1 FAD-binding oxidoreductase [Leptospira levettii]MCW7516758.1 FAD-binding oxidoreductase [Leptospira levettii]
MQTRNIYKWGSQEVEEKLPSHTLDFLNQQFPVSKEFKSNLPKGELPLKPLKKSKLTPAVISKLKKIVGNSNVTLDDVSRAKHSIGKFYTEIYKARFGEVSDVVDVVVSPKNEKEIEEILALANANKIPVIPFGAGSTVTKALQAPKGGISLDLSRLNRIIEFNAIDSTVTVEAGVYGPELEKNLNDRGYTCGHFPQSFEFSTVGGWIAAKGAGQASTGYGKIEDILLGLTAITPSGKFESKAYPAASIGPDMFRLFLGTEGSFGVITKATLKIRKYHSQNSAKGSFIFKNFESAVETMREVMQGGFGKPHFFRIQDPEETDISFHMSGLHGGKEDLFLRFIGYKPMQRSLMHIIIDGEPSYTKEVLKKIKKIAKSKGGFSTGESPVNKWLHQRYSSAYLRDYLMDEGIRIDTLETAVSWSNLHTLWENTRAYIKSFENTSCMVHISHAYENGANLYFIFISPMDKQNEVSSFVKFHKGIIDSIHENGGSLSHHHGIGRMLSPWMEKEVGEEGLRILSSLKKTFDPKGIMNPGGLLGLK